MALGLVLAWPSSLRTRRFYEVATASTIPRRRAPIATTPFNQPRTKKTVAGGPPLGGWPSGGSAGTSPLSGGTLSGIGNTPSANYVPVDLKNPRIQQWNATLEREFPWRSSIDRKSTRLNSSHRCIS